MSINTMILMPVIFFGHGSPMNAIENNQYTKSWTEIAKSIPKPKAILAISAHWESDGAKITSNIKQKTIHDFYGFPKELYDIQYNPNGDLNLVKDVQKLIPDAKADDSWGLDHGTWSVLRHIYPKADVPVLQLSIDKNKSPKDHYEMAKKIRSLRKKGVLIIGSDNIVHNLMINWNKNAKPYNWAISFNNAIKKAIQDKDHNKIVDYAKIEGAKDSVPTSEHFIPLIYILALKGDEEKVSFFNDEIEMGSLSMTSILIN